jgi:hypothetical protein
LAPEFAPEDEKGGLEGCIGVDLCDDNIHHRDLVDDITTAQTNTVVRGTWRWRPDRHKQ